MLDAAALESLTDTMNDLDVLVRGDSYADGDHLDRTIYDIRATGGEADGRSNESSTRTAR